MAPASRTSLIPRTTKEILKELIVEGDWYSIDSYQGWSQVISGTGATSRVVKRGSVDTNGDAGSTALIRLLPFPGWSRGKDPDVIDWNKEIIFYFNLANVAATTNGIGRITLGKNVTEGQGALADKGFGIQIDNLAVSGLAHDGTSLDTVDLSTTLVNGIVVDVAIKSNGNGNIEWWINNLLVGTSAGGPTGDGDPTDNTIQLEVANGADSAAQEMRTHTMRLYVEQ